MESSGSTMESSGSMQYTGERFMPLRCESSHSSISFHNERYELAAMFCRGKRVLEIGCGAGYGAAILAKTAQVDAFDYSAEAIDYCRFHYSPVDTPNYPRFFVANLLDYKCPKDAYDVVVAFEVLEHIPDGEPLMQLIKDALVPSGVALISTPSPASFGGSFDICMYTLESLRELLSGYFRDYVVLNHRPRIFSFNLKGVHTFMAVMWNDL